MDLLAKPIPKPPPGPERFLKLCFTPPEGFTLCLEELPQGVWMETPFPEVAFTLPKLSPAPGGSDRVMVGALAQGAEIRGCP